MANKKQLTGGTDDVNPQFLTESFTQSAANATDLFAIATPIIRVGSSKSGDATIMEVLKIFAVLPNFPGNAPAGQTERGILMGIFTRAPNPGTTVVPFGDPSNLYSFRETQTSAFTAGGTGTTSATENPKVADLTDGAGHGVLVATDKLYVQIDTINFLAAEQFELKILYRFKTVKLVEYIGIVQSQQ